MATALLQDLEPPNFPAEGRNLLILAYLGGHAAADSINAEDYATFAGVLPEDKSSLPRALQAVPDAACRPPSRDLVGSFRS